LDIVPTLIGLVVQVIVMTPVLWIVGRMRARPFNYLVRG